MLEGKGPRLFLVSQDVVRMHPGSVAADRRLWAPLVKSTAEVDPWFIRSRTQAPKP